MRAGPARWATRWLLAALFLSVAVFTACSTGSKSAGTPTPDTRIPTIPPLPTLAANPFDVTLTPFASVSGKYTMDVPPGWVTKGIGNTQEETFQYWSDNLLRSEIGITCEPIISRNGKPWTADDYVNRDLGFLKLAAGAPVQGQVDSQSTLTVDDTPASVVIYHVNAGGVTVRQEGVYLIKDGCAWIIRLRIFSPGPSNDYVTLFGRMLATFRTTPG